ncbi:MAG TPA: hypothetical protein GXX75_01920 [Clostridiales bacterium]|nr:hypothetical protein [Clostridiales bacterium]
MADQMLNAYEKTIKDEATQVVYKLVFKNALYSLECYYEQMKHKNYCYLENFTEDEGEAEFFLHLIAKGKALPIHIKDIAEDYFGKRFSVPKGYPRDL